MAFTSRHGVVIRQSVSRNIASNAPATLSWSMLNTIRMMATKVFVGGLSYDIDSKSLKEAFDRSGHHAVDGETNVVYDRESGTPRGFGFVTFNNDDDAEKAIYAMDGVELNGRKIGVSPAVDPRTGGGNGSGSGGGFGGGSWEK